MSGDCTIVEYVRCPDCKGKKRVFAHVNRGEKGCDFRHIDCSRCKAFGEIPKEQLGWIESGRKLRAERVARDVSLFEEARRLGLTSVQLSDIETGRVNPSTPAARRGEG